MDLYRSGHQEKALSVLISLHKERLYQVCRRMLGSHALADDALQNCFIKVWKSLGQFQGQSSLSTWLYRIASNACLDILRREQKHQVLDLDSAGSIQGSSVHGPNAEEIQSQLQTAIQSLPPKQRLVFCMRYFEALKYEEMAKITGTSVGALKSSYHLSVKKIEGILRKRSNLSPLSTSKD